MAGGLQSHLNKRQLWIFMVNTSLKARMPIYLNNGRFGIFIGQCCFTGGMHTHYLNAVQFRVITTGRYFTGSSVPVSSRTGCLPHLSDAMYLSSPSHVCLVGLALHHPTPLAPPPSPSSRAAGLGSVPSFAVDLVSSSSHTSDFNMGTPVAALPGAWCYRVSAGTSRPVVGVQ